MRFGSGALVTIFITILIDLLGFGMVIPMIILLGDKVGATALELTVLGGAYSLTQFFFAPWWGALSDRFGRRPILLTSIAASIIGYLIFGLAESIGVLIAARAFSGMCAANISAAQAYVADVTSKEQRSAGMALVGAAFGIGFTLGPPLGGVLVYYFGLNAPGLAAAMLAALNLLLAVLFLTESLPPERRQVRELRVRSPFHPGGIQACRANPTLAVLVALFFISTFAFSNFEQTFMLLFKDTLQLEHEDAGFRAGFVLMWMGVIGVIIQGGFIRRLVPRFGEIVLIRAGLLLYVLSFLIFPLVDSFEAFFLPATVLAVGSSLLNPSLAGLTSRNAHPSEQGAVLGLSQGLGSLARALGPMTGLALYGLLPWLPFYLAALITICSVLLLGTIRATTQTEPST